MNKILNPCFITKEREKEEGLDWKLTYILNWLLYVWQFPELIHDKRACQNLDTATMKEIAIGWVKWSACINFCFCLPHPMQDPLDQPQQPQLGV